MREVHLEEFQEWNEYSKKKKKNPKNKFASFVYTQYTVIWNPVKWFEFLWTFFSLKQQNFNHFSYFFLLT